MSPLCPSSLPWFSWPISICLHQSYQLTQGLDSSMPGTPNPPCIPPSLHLFLHPCYITSTIQCCHCALSWYSNSTAVLGFSVSSYDSRLLMFIKIEHLSFIAFYLSEIPPKRYLPTILWRTVILPWVLWNIFFVISHLLLISCLRSMKNGLFHLYTETWCIHE